MLRAKCFVSVRLIRTNIGIVQTWKLNVTLYWKHAVRKHQFPISVHCKASATTRYIRERRHYNLSQYQFSAICLNTFLQAFIQRSMFVHWSCALKLLHLIIILIIVWILLMTSNSFCRISSSTSPWKNMSDTCFLVSSITWLPAIINI